MSLDSALHLIFAMTYGALVWLLWWQALPTLLAKRGRMQAWRTLLTGMAMACFISGRLDLAMMNSPVRWSLIPGDVCLIAVAIIELLRAPNGVLSPEPVP